VAFICDNEVLSFRRSPELLSGGLWEFPGGKIEAGESPVDALHREVKEELEYDLYDLSPLNVAVTEVNGLQIELHCFVSRIERSTAFVSSDHDEIKWINLNDAKELDWAKPDIPALDLLMDSNKNPARQP
jgi:8-oxo-dGTP diphosphatase